MIRRIKEGFLYLSHSNLFLLGYVIVFYQYFVDLWFGNVTVDNPVFMFSQTIIPAIILANIGLVAFLLGFSIKGGYKLRAGIGEVNYTVTNQTIVPGSYTMNTHEDKNNIFLITCDPIGSTANRLIVEGNMSSFSSVNEEILNENPQQYNALIVMGIFLILGLAIAYFTPKETRIYILITVAVIMVMLIYFYLFPIPSDAIYSKINWLNGGFMEV